METVFCVDFRTWHDLADRHDGESIRKINMNGEDVFAVAVDNGAYVISPAGYAKAFGKLPTCKIDRYDGDHRTFVL